MEDGGGHAGLPARGVQSLDAWRRLGSALHCPAKRLLSGTKPVLWLHFTAASRLMRDLGTGPQQNNLGSTVEHTILPS